MRSRPRLRPQHPTTIPVVLRASHVLPRPSPIVLLRPGRTHARIPRRQPAGGRGWAGLPELAGRFRPPNVPPLLFGPLTSNEEQAGREGRGCSGVGRARQARARERRGHVTATLASGRGGDALPGSPSPPAAAAAPKQLPLVNNSCARTPPRLAPGSRTCDLLLSSAPPPPDHLGPACEAVSSSARTQR